MEIMETSSQEEPQPKAEGAVSLNTLLEDLDISSSSGSGEEQPCLAAARVNEDWNASAGPSATIVCTPQSTTVEVEACHSTSSRERHAGASDPKAGGQQLRDSGDHKLIDLGLNYDSLSSDTDDQEVGRKLVLMLNDVPVLVRCFCILPSL